MSSDVIWRKNVCGLQAEFKLWQGQASGDMLNRFLLMYGSLIAILKSQ